jgi:hypothetical protein
MNGHNADPVQLTQALAGANRMAEFRRLHGQLISELEACLVESVRLEAHLLAVEQVGGASVREGVLAHEREKLVVAQGLSVLNDDELLHLFFSPDALVNLHHQVEPNEYWVDRFAQAGAAEVEALPEDARQALLARRKAFEQQFMELVRASASVPPAASTEMPSVADGPLLTPRPSVLERLAGIPGRVSGHLSRAAASLFQGAARAAEPDNSPIVLSFSDTSLRGEVMPRFGLGRLGTERWVADSLSETEGQSQSGLVRWRRRVADGEVTIDFDSAELALVDHLLRLRAGDRRWAVRLYRVSPDRVGGTVRFAAEQRQGVPPDAPLTIEGIEPGPLLQHEEDNDRQGAKE